MRFAKYLHEGPADLTEADYEIHTCRVSITTRSAHDSQPPRSASRTPLPDPATSTRWVTLAPVGLGSVPPPDPPRLLQPRRPRRLPTCLARSRQLRPGSTARSLAST